MDDAFRQMVATRVGYDPVAIITPGDPGYVLLNTNFQIVTVSELEAYAWHWNTIDKVFAVTAITAGEGQDQYQGKILLDQENIEVTRVHQNGFNLNYDRLGKELLLWKYDANVVDITVRGQWLCETQQWPELFREAIVNRLAGLLAGSLMQRTNVADWFDSRANVFLERLRGIDSRQQTNQRIYATQIATARRTPYTSLRKPTGVNSG